MLSRSEPQEEIEIATNKITTMFLYFGKSEPQRSYKHGSYKKTSLGKQRCGFSMQFSYQYFFHFMDDTYHLLDFAIDFAIFTMWLQLYGWTDG